MGVSQQLACCALLFCFLAGSFSCTIPDEPFASDDTAESSVSSNIYATRLPSDVQLLYRDANTTARRDDTVFLYCQGVLPVDTLDTNSLDDFIRNYELSEYKVVSVLQSGIYNQEIIVGLNENLPYERAVLEDSVSVEMLDRVVSHYETLGSKIFIVGHSFGGLIASKWMSKGNNLSRVEKLLLAGTRIEVPDFVLKGYRSLSPFFFEDGITPIIVDLSSLPFFVPKKRLEYKSRLLLYAALLEEDYMSLLAGKDLSKVMYVYGEEDETIGRPTTEEVQFLHNQGAHVHFVRERGNFAFLSHRATVAILSDWLVD